MCFVPLLSFGNARGPEKKGEPRNAIAALEPEKRKTAPKKGRDALSEHKPATKATKTGALQWPLHSGPKGPKKTA